MWFVKEGFPWNSLTVFTVNCKGDMYERLSIDSILLLYFKIFLSNNYFHCMVINTFFTSKKKESVDYLI